MKVQKVNLISVSSPSVVRQSVDIEEGEVSKRGVNAPWSNAALDAKTNAASAYIIGAHWELQRAPSF